MKTKNPELKPAKLSTWLFWGAAKFGLMSITLMLLITVTLGLLGRAMGDNIVPKSFLVTMMGLIAVYAIWRTFRGLGARTMDRTGFIAVDAGVTFIYYALSLAFVVVGTWWGPSLFNAAASIGFLAGLIFFWLGGLVGLFLIGLPIINVYALYRRCVALGIPKWKIILSIPCSLLNIACYMVPDKKSQKPAIDIPQNRFGRLVHWVGARRRNTWIFLWGLATLGVLWGYQAGLISILLLGVYYIWERVTGTEELHKNIGGTFATVAVILNIVILIASISWGIHNATARQRATATSSDIVVMDNTANTTQQTENNE